jgi:hypothetical protein
LNAPPLDGGCSRGYIVNELWMRIWPIPKTGRAPRVFFFLFFFARNQNPFEFDFYFKKRKKLFLKWRNLRVLSYSSFNLLYEPFLELYIILRFPSKCLLLLLLLLLLWALNNIECKQMVVGRPWAFASSSHVWCIRLFFVSSNWRKLCNT